MNARILRIEPYTADDDLIDETKRDRMPRVRIDAAPGIMVVIGRGSKPELELDIDACITDGIPVRKRRGGGCSVVLDPGNVIVSVVIPMRGALNAGRLFDPISDWLIEGLEAVGIAGVYSDGISDIVVENRKVGGACIYRSKEVLYYSTTLLVSPAMENVSRYLIHPPREPEYRKGRDHWDFMRGLAPSIWRNGARELVDELRKVLFPGDALLAVKRGAGSRISRRGE